MISSCDYHTFYTSQNLFVKYTGSGIPLLAIHGIIGDSSFFDGYFEQMSASTADYMLISYDRRSYGKSTIQEYSDYSVSTQAEDAAEILRTLDRGPALILGNSAGSLIGLELTLKYPELVRGLLMVEPSLGYSDHSREILLAWNKELNEYKNTKKYKKALVAFTRVTGGPEATGGSVATGGSIATGAAGASRKSMDLKQLKQTYLNLTAFMDGELNEVQHYTPPIDTLRSIRIPVTIAVTRDGADSLFATSSKDAAEIIGWPTITLPGYHGTLQDNPTQTAAITRTFWEHILK